jgi:hypothetical protein
VITRPGALGVNSTITATSGGDTLVAEVADLGSNLSAHPILAPGEAVHAGQLVRLAVDPGFDRVQWSDFASVSVQNGGDPVWTTVSISPPSAEGVLEVQLPSTLPSGAMRVLVGVKGFPAITRCEGAGRCVAAPSTMVDCTAQFDTVP